jgi:sugar lactone lactonase YvrE
VSLPAIPDVASSPPPRRRRRLALAAAVLAGVPLLGALVLLALPAPIDAAPWQPPSPPPLVGPLAADAALADAELLAVGLPGPEDVAFDADGRLYTGAADGRIWRLDPANPTAPEVFAETGGRPLGLRFGPDGALYVADAERGLLVVAADGEVRPLADEADGAPITYADELDVARDGTVYFSDASARFARGFPFDLLESRPHGRLLAYDPGTGVTRVVLDGLYFANGVVLSPAQDYVLVVESFRYRITRFWLAGPLAGQTDRFAENLVGIPDNIDVGADGSYWVAMNNLRPALLDGLHPRPFLKNQLAKLGEGAWRALAARTRYGLVVRLDPEGRVIDSLHDPGGRLFNLSTATPHDGHLYLGTLFGEAVGRVPLP